MMATWKLFNYLKIFAISTNDTINIRMEPLTFPSLPFFLSNDLTCYNSSNDGDKQCFCVIIKTCFVVVWIVSCFSLVSYTRKTTIFGTERTEMWRRNSFACSSQLSWWNENCCRLGFHAWGVSCLVKRRMSCLFQRLLCFRLLLLTRLCHHWPIKAWTPQDIVYFQLISFSFQSFLLLFSDISFKFQKSFNFQSKHL